MANEWILVPKNDPKDQIQVEIGDTKQTDFYPQVKLMRWDNEVNMSFRLSESLTGATLTWDPQNQILTWVKPDKDVKFYELPVSAGLPEGGFEMEVVLKTQPASNVLEYTISTKEFDFFYQPELTQEEIDDGHERPDNVVGSYAVYHKTKGGMNDATGMDYKVGKAFHIYRPKIYDAEDNWVWGELNIDVQAGTQTITIPQDFLDNAVYPVRHASGETFGFIGIGGSGNNTNDYFLSNKGTIGASEGTMTKIQTASSDSGGNSYIRMAVYTDNSGPDALVDDSDSGSLTITRTTKPTQDSEWTSSVVPTATLSANTDYWLAFNMDDNTILTYFDVGDAGALQYYALDYSSFPPGTTGSLSGTTNKFSIYATYTPSGGGESVSPSISPSPSVSISPSVSPSPSVSISPSVSPSPSVSISPSVSPSPSVSISPSVSPSPSPGWESYTRGDYAALPGNDNQLETGYSTQDYLDVDTKNEVRVAQTATGEHAIHQFKDYVGAEASCGLEWEGQTSLDPSTSIVYLQIYNQNTTTWDAVDSYNTSTIDTDFTLSGNVPDLTNYEDSGTISCRVYQEMT